MFFKMPTRLPEELIINILNKLPPKDAMSVFYASTELQAFIKDDSIWKGFGATNFEEFVKQFKLLENFDNLRHLVLTGQCTLPLAIQVMEMLKLEPKDRIKKLWTLLIPEKPIDDHIVDQIDLNHVLLSENGVMALCANLIPLETAFAMPYQNLAELLSKNGMVALRERLIYPEQVIPMDSFQVNALFRDELEGLTALREKLITPEQAASIDFSALMGLLHKSGIIALRKKLITLEQVQNTTNARSSAINTLFSRDPDSNAFLEKLITLEQAEKMTLDQLQRITNELGFVGLRDKLFTPEQAMEIKDDPRLFYLTNNLPLIRDNLISAEHFIKLPNNSCNILFSKNGIIALREKLITADQAVSMSSYHLHNLLSDRGIEALREKLTTAESAMTIRPNVLYCLLTVGSVAWRKNIVTPDDFQNINDPVAITEIINNKVAEFNSQQTPSKNH